MENELTKSNLREIADRLAEHTAGYTGFLCWARGEIEVADEEDGEDKDLAWRKPFLVFAGRGRVRVYQSILGEHRYEIEKYTKQSIEAADAEREEWLKEVYNEVAELLERAYPFLVDAYKRNYRGPEGGDLGWDFDDFMEERDLLEFFLIGVGDEFPTTELSVGLFEHDCLVRERIAELGLDNYQEEYFPGRVSWYPPRFWWHQRPEERTPHPDSLEA
jgi:hypothetical protein